MHEPMRTWSTRLPARFRTTSMLPGEWGQAIFGSSVERSISKSPS
ncbi:MAG: hypothetical protein ACOXZ7_03310 [Sphaerochaeta sp.]